ncbi:MAG: Rieske 2Fe-2S domain-containing protein, partial [Chromatiales bacterium]|nr:Rieske 2Fe-2S domain-containing protein [Chromatiales bacterium]
MASSWVNVDMAQAIPVGDYRVVTLATTEVAVINVDGKFYAIEDICTHDYSGLTGGDICGREIICPRHGAG